MLTVTFYYLQFLKIVNFKNNDNNIYDYERTLYDV